MTVFYAILVASLVMLAANRQMKVPGRYGLYVVLIVSAVSVGFVNSSGTHPVMSDTAHVTLIMFVIAIVSFAECAYRELLADISAGRGRS